MTATRRLGAADSETRAALLDVTAAIMIEEGYAAATSRRVAARAGVKPALVHYYFHTMDDLFLALFRKGAEANLSRYEQALAAHQPLRVLWRLAREPDGVVLLAEFQALANHRKTIRAEIAEYVERFRALEIKAVAARFASRGYEAVPAGAVTVVMSAVARVLVIEDVMGVTTGHQEVLDLVERYLDQLEPSAAESGPA
ncbi:TetR family transcriptional regulator [Frankia sp. AgKG'84/4]|nr:TetR family transcriptional regulator [Frankia sp. AgKG'84/4]